MPTIDDSKCVLITGATSGIGRALAAKIAELPSNPVVIGTGRREDRLEALARNGIQPLLLNVNSDVATLRKSIQGILEKYPQLDTIILNAGIQHEIDLKNLKDVDVSNLVDEISVNYISVVSTITYILPHFLKLSEQGRPTFIVPVTSGLGVVPAPWVPNYSASKAALRSFSTSLRAQLDGTNVHVLEIIPPLVESELHDAYGTTEKLSKFWMPLDEYIEVTMKGLRNGDPYISAGSSKDSFDKFDRPKYDAALQIAKRRADW